MAARPTKNPRIAFVPSDVVHALVRRVSDMSGKSRASIVAEILDDVAPVLQGQLDAMEKIAGKPEEARALVAAYANEAIATIAQAQLDLDEPKQKPGRKRKPRRLSHAEA